MTTNLQESESLLASTKRLLNRFDLRARKGLAQHFLINREVLHNTVAAAELSKNDLVMEIGPGLGVLTRELAKASGWVVAVELDGTLASLLKNNIAPFQNITVINQDALAESPGDLLDQIKDQLPAGLSGGYKVVANLPYYITSAIFRHFLAAAARPKLMVIMVQKEIAQAVIAKPGDMSMLSLSVQFYGQPKIISYVPAECFYPAPKVDSAILRIDIYPRPAVEIKDEEAFFRLVKAGFKATRKQLINSLSRGLELPREEIQSLLDNAGIDPKRRAETLTLEEWARLYQTLIEMK
jgi:16S rRNA (adenine1518-N6/adenine1519-N6)-dimethyltransferase